MLENEPNHGETADDQRSAGTAADGVDQAAAGTADGQPAVKAVRTRRARATRPAGPPAENVPPPAVPVAVTTSAASAALTAPAETAAPAEASAAAEASSADEASSAADPASAAEPRTTKTTRSRAARTTGSRAARTAGSRAAKTADQAAPETGDLPATTDADAAETGAAETGAARTGAARTGAARTGAAKTRADKTADAAAAKIGDGPAPTAAEPQAPAARDLSAPRTSSFSAPDTGDVPMTGAAGRAPAPAGFSAPEPPNPVTQPSFLPPQLIFQPPQAVSAVAPAKRAVSDEPAPAPVEADADEPGQDGEDGDRPRRRRGGRGRSKKATDPGDEAGQEQDEPVAAESAGEDTGDGNTAETRAAETRAAETRDAEARDADDGDDSADGPARRRRRRRKRGGSPDNDQPAPDDPPETVVHVREPRVSSRSAKAKDEVQGLKGSTRLEAKKQRRREGRDSGRRRPPIITESEFLARREAVDRTMVVRQRGEHTQIAVLEDDVLVEHYVDRTTHQSFVGNVYLGKVQNVLPSMEAAFVDIGKGRNAVLYAGEVNFDASGLEGQTRRIESALKSGQSVLVQVTKDPVGHKGARLTSQVSLPGRYLVYVPGAAMTGISRKLPDTERTRLKQILKQVMPEGAGVIVRTAAEGATEEELAQDVARLSAQWETIERKSKSASPPELLYSEPDLTIRVVRDIFNEDFSRLIVAGDDGWDMVNEYVSYVAPHLMDRLSRWQDTQDAFAHYRVDEQLAKALDRKVWLPSGGSLVIDKTEAMTVVDVNTGKFTGQGGNLEETVTRNNLEAAEEIVRQLRLRDIGGIIVIDFIDMVLESNRDLVLRRMLECLARDRTKHQVAEVTSLGLVQMTRKRVGSGLLEAFSVTCECCNGRGVHVSLEPTEESPSAPPRHRGDERSGTDAAKTPAAQAEDKPAGSSSSSRRRRRKTPSPVGNGSAAEAVAAIASASSEAGQDGAVSSNGHSGSAHAPEPSAAAAAAEG